MSADSANDAVQVDETVRMPLNFINGTEFKSIDVRVDYNLSWRWRRHLIKPSELAEGLFLLFKRKSSVGLKISKVLKLRPYF